MAKTMTQQLLCSLLIVLLSATLVTAEPIDIGETFPEVPLPAPDSSNQRAYLGLADQQPFTIKQVAGRVVLVEMLNVLCPHCRKQTKPYNQLYRMIEADPATRGQIKMLGVAVSNNPQEIEDFIDIYGVAFPVVADRTFKLHSALRAGPTPFSIYVLRDQPGESGVVTDTHLGVDHDMDELFSYLKDLLQMQTSEFSVLFQETKPGAEKLLPPQSETEIVKMIKDRFADQGEQPSAFRKLVLPSERRVYTASIIRNGQQQPIFAEVASRSAICDICHSVHFFYLFDQNGLVLDFVPLHLTKYGNVEWNETEVNHFSRRVVGKRLAGAWQFDNQVDAVTSATMTSAIIFNNFDQGRELLMELQREGLLGQ